MTRPDAGPSPWLDLPSLDGWRESKRVQHLYAAVETISSLLHVEVEGIERVPEGRALLVANHAFGWDSLFVMSRLLRERGRRLWVLGEHVFWKVPWLRQLARDLGTVDGSQQNLDQLLERDQWVLVLPGGLREAVKPSALRYRLLWGHRYGFVRAAIRHQTPLVPLASIGSDELFDFVGDAYARGERWFGPRGIPVPLPARWLPLPRRVPLRFLIGDALAPTVGPDRASDEVAVRRFRHEVAGALHELIDLELARRAGIRVT
jgi:1-acyl-sn-glycerol-3-phosphate acyltransferase